jgi:hypothetical protein
MRDACDTRSLCGDPSFGNPPGVHAPGGRFHISAFQFESETESQFQLFSIYPTIWVGQVPS